MPEGRHRGPLADVGTARHLAVAARARWNLLRVPAGFYLARPSLAGTEVGSRSKKQRVIAPLAKFIDWYSLQVAALLPSIRKCARGDSELMEAVEFLNGPNFIPAESKPADLEFNSNMHFRFPSPRPCAFAENNIVHGRLYRRAKDWKRFQTMILLHGGGDFLSHRFGFPQKVPAIHRAGCNAATLAAPYHFQRRVRRIDAFDHLRVAKAFAQAVAEIRALTGWLLDQRCPSVALVGFPLCGWLAGLAETRDSRLKAVILALPGVRRDRLAMEDGVSVRWSSRLQKANVQNWPASSGPVRKFVLSTRACLSPGYPRLTPARRNRCPAV